MSDAANNALAGLATSVMLFITVLILSANEWKHGRHSSK
jgi:hypothetical protein